MEPDKAWQDNLYKAIEVILQNMVDDAKRNHQQRFAAAGTEKARELQGQEYPKNMDTLRNLATESIQAQLDRERQERMWTKQTGSATKNYSPTLRPVTFEHPTRPSSPLQNGPTTITAMSSPVNATSPSGQLSRKSAIRNVLPRRPRPDPKSLRRRSASVPDLAQLSAVERDFPPNLAAWRDQSSSLSRGSNAAGHPGPHNPSFSPMKTIQPLRLQRVPLATNAHIPTDPTDESGPSGLDNAVREDDIRSAQQKVRLQGVEETSQQRRMGEESTYGELNASLREQKEESRYREMELGRRELEVNHREEQAKRKEIEWVHKEEAIMKKEGEMIQREQTAALREEELREEIRRLQEEREETKRKEEKLREQARRLEAERTEVRWREEALRKREEELQRRGTEVTACHDQQQADLRRREEGIHRQQEVRSQLEGAAMNEAEGLDRGLGQLSTEGQRQMREVGVGNAERSKMGENLGQMEHNPQPGDTHKLANGSSSGSCYPSNGSLHPSWTSPRTNARDSVGSSLLSTRTSISSSSTIPEQKDDGITNWQRRQEELYRKQQEQFRQEYERLEAEQPRGVLTRRTA